VILLAEIQILFLNNIGISYNLPSCIGVPMGYQVQPRYFEYSSPSLWQRSKDNEPQLIQR